MRTVTGGPCFGATEWGQTSGLCWELGLMQRNRGMCGEKRGWKRRRKRTERLEAWRWWEGGEEGNVVNLHDHSLRSPAVTVRCSPWSLVVRWSILYTGHFSHIYIAIDVKLVQFCINQAKYVDHDFRPPLFYALWLMSVITIWVDHYTQFTIRLIICTV